MIFATDQYENFEALNSYMKEQRNNIPKYPQLRQILDDWDIWYNGLDFLSKSSVVSVWENAKARREQVETIYKTCIPYTQPTGTTVPQVTITPSKVINYGKYIIIGSVALVSTMIIGKSIGLARRIP